MFLAAQCVGNIVASDNLRKQGSRNSVAYLREVELLIGIQVDLLGGDVEVYRFDVRRTFGDDDNLCAVLA